MIMRWLIRLAFPALGVLLLLIFFGINAPDSVTKSPKTELNTQIPAFEGLVPSPVPTEGPEIVFKWKDSDGSWHYADKPPASGSWNALAIEPAPSLPAPADPTADPDWQSPYQAPFALDPGSRKNGG